ncbi:MAG: carboxypeptidase regulatory-like domain-containing protein [Anaerolineales bacterium]|nr:carboxypeptidase regulatory-like domain-containing protein [Anaerolineales bacterium]
MAVALLALLATSFTLLFRTAMTPSPVAADAEQGAAAQTVEQINGDISVVRVQIDSAAQIELLSSWADDHELNAISDNEVYLEVTSQDMAWLDLNGFRYEVDQKRTEALRTPRSPNAGGGIPGYACYRTVEETYTTAENIVAAHPTLAEWIDIGDSWEKTQNPNAGYDLMVLKLTNQNIPGPKPVFFATSSIHAREYTPAELLTRFAEEVVNGYGTDADATWLLDHHELHFVLQANPDGRKQAETGLSWRKNTNNNFCSNSTNRGIDLNRNFDFQWGCCGGSSGSACSATFRGPSPASEPETQAYQAYGLSIFPDQRADPITAAAPLDATGTYVDIHSYSQLVLWPWGFTASGTGNAAAFTTLGRHLAYFNGYAPDQSVGLYPTDGTTDDFYYGKLGVAAFTFELGTSFFQSCSVFEETILPDNLEALWHLAKSARTPYMTAGGPDAINLALSDITVTLGDSVTLTATADDTRYENQNGTEPTQPIAAVEYYVDTPWWNGGTANAMSPSDGSFNTSVEGAVATINTAGWTGGQHLIYVRGQDSNGNWGVPTAIFLYVVDPANAATLQGYVRDATTNQPLLATVRAGVGYVTTTNPSTGFYSLLLPPGTYDVTATANNHAPDTVNNVVATAGQSIEQDFFLEPFCTIFRDDVENGNVGWSAQSPWAITTESANSPTHSWTDSPGGNYGGGADTSLTSPSLDLSDWSGVRLAFAQSCNTEAGYDFCHVEVSNDGGMSWSEIALFDGVQPSWEQVALDASMLDGAADARIRFRLTSDGSVHREGWYVDDVKLTGAGACAEPPVSLSLYLPLVAR